MKQSLLYLFSVSLFPALFLACGSRPPGPSLALRLQLPPSLAPGSARFRRLQARMSYLEVTLLSGQSELARFALPPDQWENLSLGGVGLPEDSRAHVTVAVRVWDQKAREPGAFPILVGHKQLAVKDLPREGGATVTVRLSLQVRAESFD